MIGSIVASNVINYIGFDPNKSLRYGYVQLMKLFGIKLNEVTTEKLVFSNGFIIYSLPFEIGSKNLCDESFDLVFTSPPHFNYEVYCLENPIYSNWIDEFYTPLIKESCRLVKKEIGFVALHLNDTSAGSITHFLNNISNISTLELNHKIGLLGYYSNQIRPIFIWKKK
jgi:hypothetical protein